MKCTKSVFFLVVDMRTQRENTEIIIIFIIIIFFFLGGGGVICKLLMLSKKLKPQNKVQEYTFTIVEDEPCK